MEPTTLDGVNSVVAYVIDEEYDEMITIAATPKGELLGSYVFNGVPIIVKETDSPRALAEDLLNYIDKLYSIGAAVDSEIELDDETFGELEARTVMAIAMRTGDF